MDNNDNIILLDDSDSPDIVDLIENDDIEEGEVEETSITDPAEAAAASTAIAISDNADSAPTTTTTTESTESESDLVFEVKFRSQDDYDKIQERLLKALRSAFAEEQFVFKALDVDSAEPGISAHRAAPKSAEAESEAETQPDDDLFLIDTHPANKLNAAQVPSYKRAHNDVLDETTPLRKQLKEEEANKCFRPKAQSSCFNCGGADHALRECTRPRNNARIQRARKKNSQRMERYHVDAEQRFAHIKPGKISSKTRHAMGFSRGELPFMFYRMRLLGYPPAWLEDAKVQSSGMALFNADGTEILKSDDEDGEADSFKYDINKIVDFPGFNMDPGEKFFDDFKRLNVPPLQPQDLKANFIKSLGENVAKGYKRKKLKELPTSHDLSGAATALERPADWGVHDMELEDATEETSLSAIAIEPIVAMETTTPIKKCPSPSLEDLQAQQAQLLSQLEGNNSTLEHDLTVDSSQSQSAFDSSNIELELNDSPMRTECGTPATPKSTPFKASFEGTPILKFSQYDKLPVGDNFKVGVSDVINFENLPDSTGKYEQMKDLLKNVRQTMNKLQNDDDD